MAVNSNVDIYPELTESADKMIIAEDLVDFLLLRNSKKYLSEWNPKFCDHTYNAFARIAKALSFLDNTMKDEHNDLFGELLKENFVNSESYEIFAETLATEYFSEGFDEKYFLIYCVNLSIMAIYFYNNGIVYIPDSAKLRIYWCLQKYLTSDNIWDVIDSIARNYEKILIDPVNKPTSPAISLISDKIKHQDQEQEKVSQNLNSLQIEEKSISSGMEENIFEQLKESACSFQCSKEYQKHSQYTQYSLKTRSEIGSCSLKEPESFSETSPNVTLEENKSINRLQSDNEETPDTSNINQKLILIISDFKKKMYLLWNEIKSGD